MQQSQCLLICFLHFAIFLFQWKDFASTLTKTSAFYNSFHFLVDRFYRSSLEFQHYYVMVMNTSYRYTALVIFWGSYRHFAVLWGYFYILSSNISPWIYIKNAKNNRQVKSLDVSPSCELEGVLHIVLPRKVVTTQKWNSQIFLWAERNELEM